VDLEAFVGALGGRNDRCVTDKRVVDARVRDKVCLELVEVDVESAIEAKGRGDGADDLGNETIEMLRTRARDIQIAAADVIDSFVVDEEGTVRILNRAVRGEDGIVRFHDGGGHARGWIDGKFELALLAVLGRKSLEE